MSAQDNLGKQFFTPTTDDPTHPEYTVGNRRGKSFAVTHGRVARFGDQWAALSVGAKRWTNYHPTRKAAVDEMFKMREQRDG